MRALPLGVRTDVGESTLVAAVMQRLLTIAISSALTACGPTPEETEGSSGGLDSTEGSDSGTTTETVEPESSGGEVTPAYCSTDERPSEVTIGRAMRGNGTLQIELGLWSAPIDPLACGAPYPECQLEWDAVVPLPDAHVGPYASVDVMHRRYFSPSQCNGEPSPNDSEPLDDTELTLYEVTDGCVSGKLTEVSGLEREFVAEICADA